MYKYLVIDETEWIETEFPRQHAHHCGIKFFNTLKEAKSYFLKEVISYITEREYVLESLDEDWEIHVKRFKNRDNYIKGLIKEEIKNSSFTYKDETDRKCFAILPLSEIQSLCFESEF